MKIIKRYCSIVLLFYCSIVLLGCATLWEGAKGLAGVSTRALEDNRKSAITKTFNYDYFTCYTKSLDILKHMNAYIYMQSIKKHMIAIYVSEQDTTPVGLFFKEIDATNTQVEVSSPSTYAKEFISGKVFSVLDKKITLEELEAQINAKKETGNK
ncbi:MAG: hypothetical protein COX40_00225 [Candidatus Omnitrophica bacterium CG23_combo_of_CG06-09_8_20_14_all_40_11]|nr:MAG: hypothetical protein COX40_00225 [Candidatus Omnitrophica bacterium CG23_combo_of_CG06-09_8_20_14_all_40_11]